MPKACFTLVNTVRLGGKEQAAGMRAALEKIHGYEHQKGIKQNAKGL